MEKTTSSAGFARAARKADVDDDEDDDDSEMTYAGTGFFLRR
jgi:hypothetical protein